MGDAHAGDRDALRRLLLTDVAVRVHRRAAWQPAGDVLRHLSRELTSAGLSDIAQAQDLLSRVADAISKGELPVDLIMGSGDRAFVADCAHGENEPSLQTPPVTDDHGAAADSP